MKRPQPKPSGSPEPRAPVGELYQVSLELLMVDPTRPPRSISPERVEELAGSIKAQGVLQPLIVRPSPDPEMPDRYWIVAGEALYRAAVELQLPSLPCRVQRFNQEAATVQGLVGNVRRSDWSDVDKAEALKQIKWLTGMSWEEVAELVQLSPVYVRRLGGLLQLEESVKELVRRGEIAGRTAIALKPLPPAQQVQLAEQVIREGISAEEVRRRTRRSAESRSTRTTIGPGTASKRTPGLAAESSPSAAQESAAQVTLGNLLDSVQGFCAGIEDWLRDTRRKPWELTIETQQELQELLLFTEQLLRQLMKLLHRLQLLRDPAATTQRDPSADRT